MMQLKLSDLNGLSVGGLAFNEARVEIGDGILICPFTVTRLPITPDLILVPGSDGATRLWPLIEHAGFRTADDFNAEPTPAGTAAAIIQPIASNLQQSVLKADPARVQYYKDQLAQYPKPWVGFCWTSGRAGQDFRTVPVYCAEMKAIPGTVVDLQYQTEPNPNADAMRDAFEQAGRPMVRFDAYDPVADIAEAAALYSALDVVMNTENANAVLSAALGVETLLLAPYDILGEVFSQDKWRTMRVVKPWRVVSWADVITTACGCIEMICGKTEAALERRLRELEHERRKTQ